MLKVMGWKLHHIQKKQKRGKESRMGVVISALAFCLVCLVSHYVSFGPS